MLELPAMPSPFHSPVKRTPSWSRRSRYASAVPSASPWTSSTYTSASPPDVTKLLRPDTRTAPFARTAWSSGA